MNPSRRILAKKHSTPTIAAIAAETTMRSSVEDTPSDKNTAASIMTVLASGPTISCRDDPKNAYARTATILEYSPTSGGSPARAG
jgi:hypothetical protein